MVKRFIQYPSRLCVQGRSESCIFQDQVHKLNRSTIFIHNLMFALLIPDGCPQDTILWAGGPSRMKNSSGISSRFHCVWEERSRSQRLTHGWICRDGFPPKAWPPAEQRPAHAAQESQAWTFCPSKSLPCAQSPARLGGYSHQRM